MGGKKPDLWNMKPRELRELAELQAEEIRMKHGEIRKLRKRLEALGKSASNHEGGAEPRTNSRRNPGVGTELDAIFADAGFDSLERMGWDVWSVSGDAQDRLIGKIDSWWSKLSVEDKKRNLAKAGLLPEEFRTNPGIGRPRSSVKVKDVVMTDREHEAFVRYLNVNSIGRFERADVEDFLRMLDTDPTFRGDWMGKVAERNPGEFWQTHDVGEFIRYVADKYDYPLSEAVLGDIRFYATDDRFAGLLDETVFEDIVVLWFEGIWNPDWDPKMVRAYGSLLERLKRGGSRRNPGDEFSEYPPEDRGVLREVQAAFDDFEKDLLATKRADPSALGKGFTVTYGYVPAWRSLFSPELDRKTAGLLEATLQSGILNEMFEETCQRLGDQGIIIWDDEADGTVLWAGTEKAHHRQTGE